MLQQGPLRGLLGPKLKSYTINKEHMGFFSFIEDVITAPFKGVGDVVETVGEGIVDGAEWVLDNTGPVGDFLVDASGFVGDAVTAPIKLGGAVSKGLSKLPGLGWADDMYGVVEDGLQEVNSTISPVHALAYGAQDLRTLRDAINQKNTAEGKPQLSEEDARSYRDNLRYEIRGRGSGRLGVGGSQRVGVAQGGMRKGVGTMGERQGLA